MLRALVDTFEVKRAILGAGTGRGWMQTTVICIEAARTNVPLGKGRQETGRHPLSLYPG